MPNVTVRTGCPVKRLLSCPDAARKRKSIGTVGSKMMVYGVLITNENGLTLASRSFPSALV